MAEQKEIIVAIDGAGGDKGCDSTVSAVSFALTLYPSLKLIIFGPNSLKDALDKAKLDKKRYEFVLATRVIPQDCALVETIRDYRRSSMYMALECVKRGDATAIVSAGGTGPLTVLARHLLGTLGPRPALCARMPAGVNRFTLMLDLGANAQAKAKDLYDFAKLGSIASKYYLDLEEPILRLLNVGTESQKGSHLVQEAKELIVEDKSINFDGFIEANRIFCGDCDVIVTDGFTGNVALKAAEGVATLFSEGSGIKKVFSKMARPQWLLPWQYNGSLLLGVDGIVIKSHASAGKEALAVAMVEAARASEADIAKAIKEDLQK